MTPESGSPQVVSRSLTRRFRRTAGVFLLAAAAAAALRFHALVTPVPEPQSGGTEAGLRAEFHNSRACAIMGDALCQEQLSFFYFEGVGTRREPVKGIWWLIRSFNNGNPRAAFDVGRILLTGEFGAHKNQRYAIWWLKRASEAGSANAEKLLGDAYRLGWGVPRNLETASAWYVLSAEHGNPEAAREIRALFFTQQ